MTPAGDGYRAGLWLEDFVGGRLAFLADRQLGGVDLVGHRAGRAGLHLVAALLEGLLDRSCVERVDRADALADRLAVQGDGVRGVRLVGDRDDHWPRADLVGRDRDLLLLD